MYLMGVPGPDDPARTVYNDKGDGKMRYLAVGLMASTLLLAPPAGAHESGRHEHEEATHEDEVTREEVQRKKREVREMERELRRQEQERERERDRDRDRDTVRDRDDRHPHRHARAEPPLRLWLGVGAGVGWGAVDVPCQPNSFGADCREEGTLNTYSANATLAGRHGAIRLRGLRQTDKGDDSRTPYETAALIGSRFGRSSWYGFAGYGRILHADDDFEEEDASGFAWEILFAPASDGPTGFELSFQGNSGEDVDFVAFNIGMRIGALR